MIKKEIWKDVPGYDNYYQVSSMGRVRSLDRTVIDKRGGIRFYKGEILKWVMNKGYRQRGLSKDGVLKTFRISQLVAMAFLGHECDGHTMVVDHINGDKSDDNVTNLRVVTHRANTSYGFRSDKNSCSSKYVGVVWHSTSSKWMAQVTFRKCNVFLGFYTDEIDASDAYQKALSKIENGSFNPNDYKAKLSSKYKGVTFDKKRSKWRAQITINGKQKYLGSFNTELEAHHAYQKAI